MSRFGSSPVLPVIILASSAPAGLARSAGANWKSAPTPMEAPAIFRNEWRSVSFTHTSLLDEETRGTAELFRGRREILREDQPD